MLAPLLVLAALPPPPPLPEPAPLSREDRRERGTSPDYFTKQRTYHRRERPRLGGRIAIGLDGNASGFPVRAAYALDFVFLARIPASRRNQLFTLFPEIGYSPTTGAQQTRGHLFTAGLGLGGTDSGFGVALIPRFVAGSLLGQRALGMRTGILVEYVKNNGGGVELAYQVVALPDSVVHTVHFVFFLGFYRPRVR